MAVLVVTGSGGHGDMLEDTSLNELTGRAVVRNTRPAMRRWAMEYGSYQEGF